MKNKIIFINGLHRSGTTLLRKLIRGSDDVTGFVNTGKLKDEGQHLQSVYKSAGKFNGPGQFGFSKEAYMDETHPLITPENKIKLFNEWSIYRNLKKHYLVEKSPPNLIRTRFLQEMFSDYETYFITITRHPIPSGIATQKWSLTSLDNLIEHWCICHEQYLIDRVCLKNEIMLSYEDLINDPQKTLEKISQFLHLPNSIVQSENIVDANEKYFTMRNNGEYDVPLVPWYKQPRKKWWRAITYIFSKKISKIDIQKKYSDRLLKFGYSVQIE